MQTNITIFTLTLTAAMTVPVVTMADTDAVRNSVQSDIHAGEMDTDGILSRGELRNPNINYDRVQREAELTGDPRFDNPYNAEAAEDDSRHQPRWDVLEDAKRPNRDSVYRGDSWLDW